MLALLVITCLLQLVIILLIFASTGALLKVLRLEVEPIKRPGKKIVTMAPAEPSKSHYRPIMTALNDYETALVFSPRGDSINVVLCISGNLARMDEAERLHCDTYELAENIGNYLTQKPEGE